MPFFKTGEGTISWARPRSQHISANKALIFPETQLPAQEEAVVREEHPRVDLDGVLQAGAVDIVVPVYNGLHVLKPCLDSIKAHTAYPYRLTIVDDCSDEATKRFLMEMGPHYEAQLLFNKVNKGFAATCNRGISAGDNPFVVLLNSDTVVTPGWLTKMVLALLADPRNAICNPCTNNTAMIAVPMNEGSSYRDMGRLLGQLSNPSHPEINPTGFCFMFRRQLIGQIGVLDESFKSYGEETDFWMRTLKCAAPEFKHYRAVLADDAYVFHERGGSFSALDSAAWMRQRTDGNNRFKQLHPDYGTWAANFDARGTLAYLKDLPPVPNSEAKYSVCFVTHSTAMCGGMKFIADIVNEMIEQGIDAKVANILRPGDSRKTVEVISDLRCQPVLFDSYEDFKKNFQTKCFRDGIVIAATSELMGPVHDLCDGNLTLKPLLHAQSYDPDLATTQAQVNMTTEVYDNLARGRTIACGRTVARKIEQHSGDVLDDTPVVHPGVDPLLFYPGNREDGDDRPTLAVHLSDVYKHKGYDGAIAVLDAVHGMDPDIRILAIGTSQVMDRAWITCLGPLSQPRLAHLLRTEVDYLFDPGIVHSYGMPALEGLASGCSVGMMETDGAREYAHLFPQADVFKGGCPTAIALRMVEVLNKIGRPTGVTIPESHDRRVQVKAFINALERMLVSSGVTVTDSKPKVTFITPHVRKQGGPTTIVEAANEMSKRGYDVDVRSVYRDTFNWDLMADCHVPLYFGLRVPGPTNIVVVPSDSDKHEEIKVAFPGAKRVMFKLSHNPRFKKLEEDGLKAGYDAVLTSSQWLADACSKPLEGWDHPSVEAKRIGWFNHGFKYFNVHPSQRKYNRLGQTTVVVCGLIHNHPLKGSDTFVQAAEALANKYGTQVQIIGVGENMPTQRPKWLNFMLSPTRRQFAQVLAQADFWLGCSLSEGLGRMGLEAMGSGVCCVLSHTGAEYVKDGKNALLYSPGQATQAFDCIEFLLNDQAFRGKLAYSGWETAKAASDPDPFATALDEALKAVLK